MFPMVDAVQGQEISDDENRNDFKEENSVDKEKTDQTVSNLCLVYLLSFKTESELEEHIPRHSKAKQLPSILKNK